MLVVNDTPLKAVPPPISLDGITLSYLNQDVNKPYLVVLIGKDTCMSDAAICADRILTAFYEKHPAVVVRCLRVSATTGLTITMLFRGHPTEDADARIVFRSAKIDLRHTICGEDRIIHDTDRFSAIKPVYIAMLTITKAALVEFVAVKKSKETPMRVLTVSLFVPKNFKKIGHDKVEREISETFTKLLSEEFDRPYKVLAYPTYRPYASIISEINSTDGSIVTLGERQKLYTAARQLIEQMKETYGDIL